MSASSTVHLDPGRAPTLSPDAAIDLLADQALRSEPRVDADALTAAAALLRATFAELSGTQSALAEALIASQDQLLDVTTLARISVQAVTSGETLGMLLDRALQLTGTTQVLLMEDRSVLSSSGDPTHLEEHAELAWAAIARSPRVPLRSAGPDTAMVGTLDPDAEARRHVAFFRPLDRPFSTTDIPLIEALRSTLGVMLAFDDLHRRELARAAVEREHQLASALAQSVITDAPPVSPLLDLFARSVPASLAGGDFYVFGQSDGQIWFTVGDVAGKGLPAAMLMTRAVSASRVAFLAHRDRPVVDVFARIEEELFDHLDEAGLFLTLVVGMVDEETRTVSLVNAGHSPVLLVSDGVTQTIPSSVPPLGIVRHRVPTTTTFTLQGNDRLFVGTDGLVDQCRPDGELFGYDRFSRLCESAQLVPNREVGDSVFAALDSFAAGSSPSDDSTLVVISAGADR